jgi:hypothetical protein
LEIIHPSIIILHVVVALSVSHLDLGSPSNNHLTYICVAAVVPIAKQEERLRFGFKRRERDTPQVDQYHHHRHHNLNETIRP